MNREKIIEHFDESGNIVYLPETLAEEKNRNIAIFAHILKAGGSQVAIESLIPSLQKNDFNVYVVTLEDGVYTDRLLEQFGVIVVIQKDVVVDGAYRKFLQSAFDAVILNASPSGKFAYYFINTDVPVLWWMHECNQVISAAIKNGVPHHCLVSDNFHYLCPWKKTLEEFQNSFERKMDLLPIGLADEYMHTELKAEETTFLFPGSYMNFKGFPIALEAIFKLPESIFHKCRFQFVGYVVDETLFTKMQEIADKYENIEVLPDVSYEEMQQYQQQADCVVVPSIMDAGPLVAVEALMHEKICIVSDATGIASYMHDCVDGFVYPSDNVEELFKRMLLVANDKYSLSSIAQAGRKVYLDNFTPQCEEEAFTDIVNQYLK